MGDLKDILETLGLELENQISIVLSKYQQEIEDNKILYHYTSLEGLKAIIENGSFYFSNSAYLNDKEEFLLGKKTFEDITQKIQKDKHNDKFSESLKLLNEKISKTLISENYVACFSLEGDLLSQWRAYTDDGKGVSIGFSLKELKIKLQDIDSFLMIYDKKTQIKVGTEILVNAYNFYLRNKSIIANNLNFDSIISTEVYKQILKYIGQLKHNSFMEEKEYRFEIRIDENIENDRDIQFRTSKNNLFVPYIVEKLNKESLENTKKNKFPIKEIIIGPSLDKELNKLSIESFLTKNGYKNVKVKSSNVPYRI